MRTVIFIGRSGCGKGTQAANLLAWLAQQTPTAPTLYLETGERFRQFIAEDKSLASHLAGEIMVRGGRQPDFLAVWNWSNFLIANLTGKENLVIDGAPRSRPEAETMDTAFDFFSRRPVDIVYLNVSREWAEARLSARGRDDDKTPAEIAARQQWFDEMVLPAVEYYRRQLNYRFVEINGEQLPELVAQDILSRLNLDGVQAQN